MDFILPAADGIVHFVNTNLLHFPTASADRSRIICVGERGRDFTVGTDRRNDNQIFCQWDQVDYFLIFPSTNNTEISVVHALFNCLHILFPQTIGDN